MMEPPGASAGPGVGVTVSDGDWATPGSSAAQPQAPAVVFGPVSSTGSSALGATQRSPRPLPLRPQSLLEILDGGFAIVRARSSLLLGISAVFIVPLSVLSAYLQRDLITTDGSELFNDPWLFQSTAPGGGWTAFVVGFLARSLVQSVVAVAIGLLIAAWYSDREAELTDVLKWLSRRAHVILAAWFLTHLLQGLGLVGAVVGALVVAVFTTVVAPVVAVEQAGPIEAIRRSFSLVSGRFGTVLAFFALSGLLAELLGLVLGLLPTLLGFVLTIGGGWVLVAVGSVIAGIVSTTFLAAATVALYLDLRVRREGIDIQLLIPDRFPPR